MPSACDPHETRRFKLRREAGAVLTPLGEAAVKLLYEGSELIRVTPEYESCRKLAAGSGRPLPEVYRIVERAADHLFEKGGSERRKETGILKF